jgi:hypothetical protein
VEKRDKRTGKNKLVKIFEEETRFSVTSNLRNTGKRHLRLANLHVFWSSAL